MTAPAVTGTPPAGTSTLRMPSRSEPADSAYRALDAGNRGYLSKTDVQGLEGFSFDQADANKDGRISKEEFARAWSAKK
jgi:Ca2+-binding EF-hand superfamily protein